MKKQKSGISLIVLVITIIVIIILAVAVILSIANNNPIENANKAKFQNDVKSMQEQIELIKSKNYADSKGESYGTIEFDNLTGASKYAGKFIVNSNGELCYNASKLSDNEKVWADELGIKMAITFARKEPGDLAEGSEVTASNGESFYVIGFSEDNTKVNLLAKSNLNKEGTSQGTSGECTFSSEYYWSEATDEELADLSKLAVPNGVTSIITIAKTYGESLGVIGRLMTFEEIKNLGIVESENPDYTYSTSKCKSFVNNESYWLGSGSVGGSVWFVIGGTEYLDESQFDYNYGNCGIRPVIEVLVSSIN